MMLTQEQKSRLTPEELVIAEKWEKEKEERDFLFNKIQEALSANASEAFFQAVDSLGDMQPTHCEHERSIWSRCSACDELERKLNPESYINCNGCGESIHIGELENGRCMDCGGYDEE